MQQAKCGDGRAEYAGRGAIGGARRHFRENGAITRATAAEGANIAGSADDRGADQRFAGLAAGIAQDIGCGEAIGGVDDDIGLRHQLRDIVGREPERQRFDLYTGIVCGERLTRRFDLEPPEIAHTVEWLAVQIALLDPVGIDQQQATDAGADEIG